MTFQEKLNAILQFGVGQLPIVIKNPDTQAKVLPYIGLAIGGIALIEALLMHTPVATTPATPSITPVK